jgi:hypothetical protein
MNFNPKAPTVYKPPSQRSAAPPVYRPHEASRPNVQLKSTNKFRTETRPGPPAYRPQQTQSEVQPKPTSNFRIETRSAPPVYRPQPADIFAAQQRPQAIQPRSPYQSPDQKIGFGNASTTQGSGLIATFARNCAQLQSLRLRSVVQRAKSRKCPACNGALLPTGKCPKCKVKVELSAEKPVVKDKRKEEKRAQKKQLEQRKAESAKKQEIAELGSKKGAVNAWESDKANFFEPFAGAVVPNPAGTKPAKYPIKTLDISIVAEKQPKLATLLEESLALIQIRDKTPEHQNDEERFPIYDKSENPMAYFEFSYLGGGGRLVIDVIAGIIYLSAHYSYNYKVVKNGVTPQGPVDAAKGIRRNILLWLVCDDHLPARQMHKYWKELTLEDREQVRTRVFSDPASYPNVLRHIFHRKPVQDLAGYAMK